MSSMKPISKPQKPTKTVLVVDDNEDLLRMLQRLLGREGYETHLASNGDEALKLAENTHFDLIITDLIMPGKEGVETIMTFRKLHPATKIIAMSGGGRHASGAAYLGIAQSLGVESTLVKPFSTSVFVQAVSRQLFGPTASV